MELKHYGVLGMRWGVRKDDGEKAAKANRRQNSDQITENTKVRENSDGSLTVTGLKEIDSAEFSSRETYKKWLDGDVNPYAEDQQGYVYSVLASGEKINVSGTTSTTVKGVGYTLNFNNEADYYEYINARNNNAQKIFIDKYLSKNKSEIDSINSVLERNPNDSSVATRIDALERNAGSELWKEQVNGWREYEEYRIQNSGASQEEIDEAMEALKDRVNSMGVDYDALKKISDQKDTIDKLISSFKDIKLKMPVVEQKAESGKQNIESLLDKVGNVVSDTVVMVSNVASSISNWVSSLFKR